MDASRFDRLTRSMTNSPSRRRFLGGLGAALGLAVPHVSDPVEARKEKKRKEKPRPLEFNTFACVDVGEACGGNSANCCSGVCQGTTPKPGKKDNSTCVAHDVGECEAGQDACLELGRLCGTNGICFRTTGKASFCGLGGECAVCANDTDCEALAGPGASCVVCAVDCTGSGGTACVAAAT